MRPRSWAALALVLFLAGCGFLDEELSPDCRDVGIRVKGTKVGDTYVRKDFVCGDHSNRDNCSGHDGVLCVVNRH
jgi:hypothetical protein